MFLSSSSAASATASSRPELALKPVTGKGREARWEIVTRFFREKIEPLYGSQSALLKNVRELNEIKCRLLYSNQQPVGVLVYQTTLSERFADRNFPKCLEIKSLYATDQAWNDPYKNYSSFLLNEVLKQAKLCGAESLMINLATEATDTVQFFKKHNFQLLLGTSPSPIKPYCLKIEKEEMPDRKVEKRRFEEEDSQRVRLDDGRHSRSEQEDRGFAEDKRRRVAQYPANPSSRVMTLRDQFEVSARTATPVTIQKKYFDLIRSGRKTIEGRINSGMFLRMRVGQAIQFVNQQERVECEITRITKYDSFPALLQAEGIQTCLPGTSSLEEAVRIYNNIPGYSDKANQFGVLAIQLKLS